MYCRTKLTALRHNENRNRKNLRDVEGNVLLHISRKKENKQAPTIQVRKEQVACGQCWC